MSASHDQKVINCLQAFPPDWTLMDIQTPSLNTFMLLMTLHLITCDHLLSISLFFTLNALIEADNQVPCRGTCAPDFQVVPLQQAWLIFTNQGCLFRCLNNQGG